MGPRYAATEFLSRHYDAIRYEADLFGSLAATGKGHLTDKALREVLGGTGKSVTIIWYPEVVKPFHPNAMTLRALGPQEDLLGEQTYYSVGGGKVILEGQQSLPIKRTYPQYLSKMKHILAYCEKEGIQLWELVVKYEGPEILTFIEQIWTVMLESIPRGIEAPEEGGQILRAIQRPCRSGWHSRKGLELRSCGSRRERGWREDSHRTYLWVLWSLARRAFLPEKPI